MPRSRTSTEPGTPIHRSRRDYSRALSHFHPGVARARLLRRPDLCLKMTSRMGSTRPSPGMWGSMSCRAFGLQPRLEYRRFRRRLLAGTALAGPLILATLLSSQPALADCTPTNPASGDTVTCAATRHRYGFAAGDGTSERQSHGQRAVRRDGFGDPFRQSGSSTQATLSPATGPSTPQTLESAPRLMTTTTSPTTARSASATTAPRSS